MPVVIPPAPDGTRYTIAADWQIPETTILRGEAPRFKLMFLQGGMAESETLAFWSVSLIQSLAPFKKGYFAQPDELDVFASGFTCLEGQLPPLCEYFKRCYPVPQFWLDAYTYYVELHYFHMLATASEWPRPRADPSDWRFQWVRDWKQHCSGLMTRLKDEQVIVGRLKDELACGMPTSDLTTFQWEGFWQATGIARWEGFWRATGIARSRVAHRHKI